MLIPLTLILITVLAPQDNSSLFTRLVPVPTGSNGYEEYLKAADIVRLAGTTLEDRALSSIPEGKDWVVERGNWIKACSAALDLVRAGNNKAVTNPREKMTWATTFEEFGAFKSIAKLFMCEAFVRYANGNPGGGTQSLIDCIRFGENIGRQSTMANLMGIIARTIAHSAFNQLIANWSLADCEKIITCCNDILSRPNFTVQAITNTRIGPEFVTDMISQPGETIFAINPGEDEAVADRWVAQFRETGPDQRRTLAREVVDSVAASRARLLALLARPEKEWVMSAPPPPSTIHGALLKSLCGIDYQLLTAAARSRAQLRLLRLHASIVAYKWRFGKLPAKLVELKQDDYVKDPLAGGSFAYEVRDGTYELYSTGNDATGRVDLVRKPPVPGYSPDWPPPVIPRI